MPIVFNSGMALRSPYLLIARTAQPRRPELDKQGPKNKKIKLKWLSKHRPPAGLVGYRFKMSFSTVLKRRDSQNRVGRSIGSVRYRHYSIYEH